VSAADYADGTEQMVRADEIRWTLGPNDPPRREDTNPVDLYALAHEDLLEFAYESLDELRILRTSVSESLVTIASQTETIKRLTRVLAQKRARG
jgi:hypothetical protein